MALFETLFSKIAALPFSPLKDKIARTEVVIKLLRELHLDPAHPSKDFPSVYQYTLVEYGVGKPAPILELFRDEDIYKAFRRAFEQDDYSILQKEGERLLDGLKIGDEVRELGINPQQEFADFRAVFHRIVDRSRMPAEVRQDQILNKIYDGLQKLLKKDRVQRREPLLEVLTPIYNNLEEIHREYLIELSAAHNKVAADSDILEEVLRYLQSQRVLKESERQKLIATCDSLVARKWRPEVKQFLTSARDYFRLPVRDDYSYLTEQVDKPKQEICSIIKRFTAYTRVIAVLKHMIGQNSDSSEAQSAVLAVIEDTLNFLRSAWYNVSGSFANINADSVEGHIDNR